MNARDVLVQEFLQSVGWHSADRIVVAGDASNRKYERLTDAHGDPVILMDAPPDKGEDVRPFIQIAEFLNSVGLSAPSIVAADENNGFLLLEDLGDDIYARVLEKTPHLETELYGFAVDALTHLHDRAPPELPVYDAAAMTPLAALAFDWYQKGASGQTEGKDTFSEMFEKVLAAQDLEQPVLIQRDYHAENLLWLPKRKGVARVGLLDFQDAMLGHPAYDLVSVLQDARRDVPVEIETRMINRFTTAKNTDQQDFRHAYTLCGLQRNLRILGVFARLSMAYGKKHYVDLIPRVWSHYERDLDACENAALQDHLRTHLPKPTPDILKRLKDQCGQHDLP